MVERFGRIHQELLDVGEAAQATIISVEDTGVHVGVNPFYQFQLEVKPNDNPPFTAETGSFIPFAHLTKFQAGSKVWVKFDPQDRTRVTTIPVSLWDKLG